MQLISQEKLPVVAVGFVRNVPAWPVPESEFFGFVYTAVSRKVVGKSVRAIPNCFMGNSSYCYLIDLLVALTR